MKHLQHLCLAALLGSPSARGLEPTQEPSTTPAASPHALERPREVLRFYSLATDKPELAAASGALEALGVSVVYGPQTAPRRKGASFVVVRAPVQTAERELEKALRRAGGAARPLVCTVFEGAEPPHEGLLDDDTLDDLLAWFDSAAWIDFSGARTQMYFERGPSAKEAKAITERYAMMYEQNVRLGQLATETFTWELAVAPEASSAARVLRDVRKLAGVAGATLVGTTLTVAIELLALDTSGVGIVSSKDSGGRPDPTGRTAPRASWSPLALHELLLAQGLLETQGQGK